MKRFLFALLTLPVSAFADGGLPTQPYIYVEGKAEIEKPADMVTLRFELVARNPDQAKANQEVQAKSGKILGLLNDRKIAESDVIAAEVKAEPEFEEDSSGRKTGKLIGYNVTRGFQVKVRDLPIFPKLVDELIGMTGVKFSDLDAGLTKEKEIQQEIWEKALVNAREQADKTAKAMGVKIDSVFAISPTPFPQIRGQMFRSDYGEGRTERVIVTGPPEYRLGSMTVSQNVHVLYLISSAK
jgi:uncharacterized protein YggE